MKTLMISGALIGFCLGVTLALAGEADWPSAFWRGCAGAAILGLLMRWWAGVWVRSLKNALQQRQIVQAKAAPARPLAPALKS